MGKENAGYGGELSNKNYGSYLRVSRKDDVIKRLRRQFYLGMRGLYQKLAGAAPQELAETFCAAARQTMPWMNGEAVNRTLPWMDGEALHRPVLCAEEINLILEYAQCLPLQRAILWCRGLLRYLTETGMEDDTRVLNYPKAALVLCRLFIGQEGAGIREYTQVIRLCGLGVDLLRKTKKAYYLLELLDMKRTAILHIQGIHCSRGELQRVQALNGMLAEAEDCLRLIGGLYERFGVQAVQKFDTFLYRGQDIYDIGKIIRTRRRLRGMTQKELCRDICTLDTLKDMEHGKHGSRPVYLRELCERLGLSPVCDRTELVTAMPEARRLEKEIRYRANEGDFAENLVQIQKLKTMIDMSDPINRQWVLRAEGMARYKLGEIGREEYEKEIRQAIECMLPMSILELPDEQGEYEHAKQYNEEIIRLCLLMGRMNMLDKVLYEWMCSNRKLQGKGEPEGSDYDWKKDLGRCLALSRFFGNIVEERFYKEILESMNRKSN